jgi:outer membrane protein assembly factor BamB
MMEGISFSQRKNALLGKDRAMSRRALLGWVLLLLISLEARGQVPFSKDLVPAQGVMLNGEALTPLARVGLERNWYSIVPLDRNERVLLLSLAENMVFAQTTESNLHAFDAETGRHLWVADLGPKSVLALPVSVNSFGVFATGAHTLYGLDRANGKTLWSLPLESMPSSGTAADEKYVSVGLNTGKLATYDLKTRYPAFFWKTDDQLTSQPILAGPVSAFASQDGRLYVSLIDPPRPVFRFLTGGPVSASMGTHGTRTLIVPSTDNTVFAIDLFTGDTRWSLPTGSPIDQQPLVAQDDVYVINRRGLLIAINVNNGEVEWELPTGGGRLLSVGEKRVYLESPFRDLYIVDRKSGSLVFDARAVRERAGLNLREFELTPTNIYTGRLFLASTTGMIVCLREYGRVKPYLLRDSSAPPFGFIPRGGESGAPPAGAAPAAAPEAGAAPAGEAKPAAEAMPPEEGAAKPGAVPAPGGAEKPK